MNSRFSLLCATTVCASFLLACPTHAHGPAPAPQGHESQGHKDIVDTAVSAGSFKTLVAAVQAAKLVGVLKSKGPFTVFAPTDEAFGRLGRNSLRSLLRPENRARLAAILTYHVVPGRVLAKDVVKLTRATTVNGQRVAIDAGKGVKIDSSNVTKTDILCTNGVIHVIDRVLIPSEANIAETAQKAKKFGTLLAAAKAAGLVDALVGKGPLTVFAPTDEAFEKLPKGTVATLLKPENRSKLASILKYHVVKGRVYSDDAVIAGKANTLQKSPIALAIRGGRLQVDKANVVANDIQASNGVIHVIDAVLMPPKPRGPKVVGVTISRPSAALASQLDVSRSKTLLVTSVSGSAKKAGIRKYDVLTKIAGRAATQSNLDKVKAATEFGEPIRFEVRRGSRTLKIDVPLGTH